MFPPADSNAYWFGESLSTDNSTVCASKLNGPRKLKSTVLDDVTVARVTIRNCRRYDWMLARRALHSSNGWLMCKVFSRSIGFQWFSEKLLSNSNASSFPKGIRVEDDRMLFVFVTTLYQGNTLNEQCRPAAGNGRSMRLSPRFRERRCSSYLFRALGGIR